MVLMLNVHPSRAPDIIRPDQLRIAPTLPATRYTDAFGNICTRLVAPAGQVEISTEALVADSGLPDAVEPDARQHEVAELPHDVLVFLLASRYCETDRLMQDAWARFGKTPLGWPRVQAICDFVHSHVRFGYQHARATKTAAEVAVERRGVCRDFAHLAITLCRCMNIPARYCTGYLGDIGVPPEPEPMDFSAWFEAYLGGRWYSFDARHNIPRIGRIVMARGRDAADVAISTTFGPNLLKCFVVHTDEVMPAAMELIERKVA
jgi:transglutaminase-like putative cysteine protease